MKQITTFSSPGIRSSLVLATAVAGAIGVASPAWAQQTLPPIIVEGTTIAAKPARPAPVPQPADAASSPPAADAGTSQDAAEPAAGGLFAIPGASAGASSPGGPSSFAASGSAVSVMTASDLKARQIRHAADALRSLPGVSVNRSGSFTGLAQVRIRGAEANHTVVLIDGIEANSANNGEFDFANLSTDDIERIEVIRGAQSALYGANAIGGVINIITKGGGGPMTLSMKGEAGSFNTKDASARISAGNERAWVSASIHKRTSDGYDIAPRGSEKDDAELTSASVKAGLEIVRDLDVDIVVRDQKTRGGRDTEGATLGELQEQVDSPATFRNSDRMMGARLRWSMAGGALIHQLRASHTENTVLDTAPDFVTRNASETTTYDYRATLRLPTPGVPGVMHTITGLVEKRRDGFTPQSDFADGLERARHRLSFAGEWNGRFFDRLSLTAGVRHDDNDSFTDFTTWRTTGSLDITEIGLRPHASYGTAYKAPTMYEQYGSIPTFFTPNPNLEPEESSSWDAGLEVSVWQRMLVLDVTYFNSELTNKIDGFAPGPNFTFTAANMQGRSDREGIEASGRVLLLPGLTLSGAYTYLETLNPDGFRDVRRPRHAARADLDWSFDEDRGHLNLGAIYNGEMDDPVRRVTGFFFGFPTLQAERFRLDDYTVVNLAASYEVQPGVEIFGRVENMLDTRYQEIYGFESAPVAAYAGMRLTFNDLANSTSGR